MRTRQMQVGCFLVLHLCCSSVGAAAGDTGAAALTARGVVRASVDTVLSTELVAHVDQVPFKEGDAFRKGDVVVRFDCARYVAERRAAAAELRTTQLEVKSNAKLLRHKAIGAVEVEVSRARRDQMRARLDALLVRERQCVIAAPFDGRVVERHISPFEMSKPNGPLLRLVNRVLEIDLIVPSKWVRWLRAGTSFSFHIEETGNHLAAKVARISAVVDPISRTVRVVGHIVGDGSGTLPGMSGAATFDAPGG